MNCTLSAGSMYGIGAIGAGGYPYIGGIGYPWGGYPGGGYPGGGDPGGGDPGGGYAGGGYPGGSPGGTCGFICADRPCERSRWTTTGARAALACVAFFTASAVIQVAPAIGLIAVTAALARSVRPQPTSAAPWPFSCFAISTLLASFFCASVVRSSPMRRLSPSGDMSAMRAATCSAIAACGGSIDATAGSDATFSTEEITLCSAAQG